MPKSAYGNDYMDGNWQAANSSASTPSLDHVPGFDYLEKRLIVEVDGGQHLAGERD